MTPTFNKFEKFGSIGNEASRKKMAERIHDFIRSKKPSTTGLSDSETENFASSIDEIISDATLKEMCSKDSDLAEKVTSEILDFVNSAKREINTTANPFDSERKKVSELSKTSQAKFAEAWPKADQYLKSNYSSKQIDPSFYTAQFQESLFSKKKDRPSFEAVREHLTEKWEGLIDAKQTQWELNIIDKWRKKVAEDLYRRLEEVKQLQQLLEPFTDELGRLFDMSSGKWQKVNFELLKRYAELLKNDKALKELAEMLGRMQEAEKEVEQELFQNTRIKNEWQIEHASRSDLVGIRESDDLSSLLPSETALLADPSLQAVFMKKFAEKKLQTFEYEGRFLSSNKEDFLDKREKTKETKGPFIICVDTSGSMHGTPEMVAKTLCFAILKIAFRDNRKCFLISFSTGIETLDLSDLKNSLDKIVEFLSMSFHGGTDATPALQEALNQLEKEDYTKADLLMISDFVMAGLPDSITKKISSAKEKGKTKFHSLVIGSSQNTKAMISFDNNWFYQEGNNGSMIKLVKGLRDL